MASLEKAFDFAVMVLEGGGVVHRVEGDPGGTTKFGISQRANPDLDIASLTRPEAIEVYRERYWDPRRLGELNSQTMADEIFEFTINADPAFASGGRAVKAAQVSANRVLQHMDRPLVLEDDGIMGDITLGALNYIAGSPLAVMAWEGAPECFNVRQLVHYRGLRRDLVRRFLYGWTRRIVE